MQVSIGDTVRLKARFAQQMQVIGIEGDWVICRWFDNSAVQEAAFAADDIETVPEARD
jgi:Uncharacterized small protein